MFGLKKKKKVKKYVFYTSVKGNVITGLPFTYASDVNVEINKEFIRFSSFETVVDFKIHEFFSIQMLNFYTLEKLFNNGKIICEIPDGVSAKVESIAYNSDLRRSIRFLLFVYPENNVYKGILLQINDEWINGSNLVNYFNNNTVMGKINAQKDL
ncbi:MAG: hypothetical protein ACK5LV_04485 [Lachnospirales bacterium]